MAVWLSRATDMEPVAVIDGAFTVRVTVLLATETSNPLVTKAWISKPSMLESSATVV